MSDNLAEIKGAVRAMLAAGDSAEALAYAERAAETYPNSSGLTDLTVALLDHLGQPEQALTLAARSARHRLKRLAGRVGTRTVPALGLTGRIFACGYFYSGSGALVDFLRGFPGVVKWSPYGEYRLIKAPGGLVAYEKSMLAGADIQALVDLYLNLVGQKVASTYQWRTSNNSSSKMMGDKRARAYMLAVLRLWQSVYALRPSSRAEFRALCRKGLAAALDGGAQGYGARWLLIDQAINAWRLHFSHFVPPSTFFVVDRDPRDHFFEARLGWEKFGRTLTVDEYLASYVSIREKSAQRMATLGQSLGHRFLTYNFEDFVCDHANQAARLQADLQIEGQSSGYDPERSRLNIGRYKSGLSRSEIARIETTLRPYLHPAAD